MPAPVHRVLFVDDDPVILKMVRRYLSNKGMEVAVADTPFGVSTRVTRERPDVVVLDVMMPALDGEALAKLLSSLKGPPLKLIFYSAIDETELARIASRFPGSRYVSKASSLSTLYAAVVRSVNERSA